MNNADQWEAANRRNAHNLRDARNRHLLQNPEAQVRRRYTLFWAI